MLIEPKSNSPMKVLIVDDEIFIRESLSIFLEDEGFEVLTAENGLTGIEGFRNNQPDIVILDLRMPEMSGMEVIPKIREITDLVPIIIISGNNEVSDAVEALRIGAWDYITKPIQDLNMMLHRMELVLNQALLLKENRNYHNHLEEMVDERTKDLQLNQSKLSEAMFNTILVLTQTIEAKDPYTRGHCLHVSEYSVAIGRELGFSKTDLYNLQLGALLHDIGKTGIPGIILNKPGKLTPEEYEVIKKHPEIGENILKHIDYFKPFLHIIRHHHEWDNGNGYPDKEIGSTSVSSAVVAVADVYDSLITDRPYRNAMTTEKALKILKEQKGTQFCPKIVDLFLDKKIYRIQHNDKLKIEFNF